MQTSKTVTVKPQVAVLPEASVAVHVTAVVPIGKHDPDAGLQTKVTPGQLSLTVRSGKLTTWQGADMHVFWLVTAVTFAGQVIDGGWVSLTVTVNEQLGPAVVLQVTVVTPTEKTEPETGVQVTVPHSPPVVVGAG